MENFENFNQQEESLDIKAILFKFSKYWYLFAISVFVAVIIAFLFNKYTSPEYEVTTTVLVKDKGTSNLDPATLLGLGFANTQQNIENEIGKLNSFSLAYKTVQDLDFQVSYSLSEGLITKELYEKVPFEVVFDTTIPQAVGLKYNLKFINKDQFTLEAEGEMVKKYNFAKRGFVSGKFEKVDYKGTFHLGQLVQNKFNSFKIILNSNFDPEEDFKNEYHFVFTDYVSLTKKYMGIKIEPINRQASILKITLKSENLDKSVAYLNMLTKQYLNSNLEMKNKIAENTIKFINGQLGIISDSLQIAQKDLQQYRSNKEIMDLSFQAQQVFQYMSDLEKQRAELEIQSKYYDNLRSYIQKNEDNLNNMVAPSAMGIQDPALNALVAQLIQLYNKKAESLLYSTEKSPTILTINSQIITTKQAIIENVTNIIDNSKETIKELTGQINKISDELNKLPFTQLQLVNFERRFKLADDLYTYLLQKRGDAQITKASNTPDNEIIDKARADASNIPVFPKKSLNYLIALILGLAFPIAYVLAKDYFNDMIVERKDVETATKFPIVGQLLHSDKETQLVIAEYPKSSISESFRSMRTNIQYVAKGLSPVTVMVAADMASAGKTFVSINLASVYAQYGKKTVLLGFDLRKPKIYQDFKLSNDKGLTSYLIGKDSLDDIIQNSGVIDHLDIIMAGSVPPNPAELIASDKNADLFAELKKRYDYIVIDTPPLGLVTDAFLLMPYTDVNLFIVRQNYTHKKVFASIIKDIESRGQKMNIVINDILLEDGGYGYYGYGYGYGYGYQYGAQGGGYYTDDKPRKKRTFLRRLMNKD
ncbi:MAG: polysaccharide biosynthesis tyrosine autokinase [Bacteroidales bacterium]|nr:polysaccharide biosynthesis tyrosine autokinase [Bacteroidales bacterium]